MTTALERESMNAEAWLECVGEWQARLRDAEEDARYARADRDCYIRDAIASGVSMYAISQQIGITQQSVRAIRDAGSR